MKSLRFALLPFLALLSVAGCAAEAEPEDADFEQTAAGVTLAPEAVPALLAFVNGATAEELGEARVVWRVVDGILARRRGPDGQDGTADDRPFTSVADVDAVFGVGPVTLERLAERGRAWVAQRDPFSDGFCGDDRPLTPAQARARLAGGATAVLGRWESRVRVRSCDAAGACDAWQEAELPTFESSIGTPLAQPRSGALRLEASGDELAVRVWSNRCADRAYGSTCAVSDRTGAECTVPQLATSCASRPDEGDDTVRQMSFRRDMLGQNAAPLRALQGHVGQRCARLVATNTPRPGTAGDEWQMAFFARY